MLAADLRVGSTTAAPPPAPSASPGTLDELADRRRPPEPPPADRVAALHRRRSARARTPTAGAGSSTRRCASAASAPGARSGRCCGMPGLGMPFLGVLGLEHEEMGWGTRPDDVQPYLPPGGRFARSTTPATSCTSSSPTSSPSSSSISWHDRPSISHTLRHNTGGSAGPPPARGTGPGRPLLLLHGLGERSPETVPAWAATWPGPVSRSTSPATATPRCRRAAGYTAEVLMGDVDIALAAARRRPPCRARAGGPTSRCSSPAPDPRWCGRRAGRRPRPGRRRHARADVGDLVTVGGQRAGARRIRGRCSSCPATSGRPTTPQSTSGRHCSSPGLDTALRGCAALCGRRGWRPSPPSLGCSWSLEDGGRPLRRPALTAATMAPAGDERGEVGQTARGRRRRARCARQRRQRLVSPAARCGSPSPARRRCP